MTMGIFVSKCLCQQTVLNPDANMVFFCEILGAPSSFLGCICAKIIKFARNI